MNLCEEFPNPKEGPTSCPTGLTHLAWVPYSFPLWNVSTMSILGGTRLSPVPGNPREIRHHWASRLRTLGNGTVPLWAPRLGQDCLGDGFCCGHRKFANCCVTSASLPRGPKSVFSGTSGKGSNLSALSGRTWSRRKDFWFWECLLSLPLTIRKCSL